MKLARQIEKVIEKFLDEKEYSIVDNIGFPMLTDKLAQAIAERIEVDEDTIRAYLNDRIAEAMRESNPNIGDASFDRAKYYVENIITFLSKADIIKLK